MRPIAVFLIVVTMGLACSEGPQSSADVGDLGADSDLGSEFDIAQDVRDVGDEREPIEDWIKRNSRAEYLAQTTENLVGASSWTQELEAGELGGGNIVLYDKTGLALDYLVFAPQVAVKALAAKGTLAAVTWAVEEQLHVSLVQIDASGLGELGSLTVVGGM